MATKAKSSRRVRSTFTNNKGQRVTSFSDGTKSVVGEARNTPKVGSIVDGKRVGYTVGGKAYESGSDPEAGRAPVIATDSLGFTSKRDVADIPERPQIQDVGDLLGDTNRSLAGNGLKYDSKTGFSLEQPDIEQDTVQSAQDRQLQNFMASLGLRTAPESQAEIYRKELRRSGVEQAQQQVNDITNTLNTITANRDANILRVEGQGRGIPEAIIGGQQAQINKEAAIAALPVQAQLAAAQGNLALAQQNLDTMFKLKSADSLAQYNYRNQVIDSVLQFANARDSQRLSELKTIEDRKYQTKQDFLKTQNQLLSSAVTQGAPSSVVNAINSATSIPEAIRAAGLYGGDILARQIQQANLANINSQIQERANPTGKEKPLTEVQQKTLGFAERMQEANKVIEQLGDRFTGASGYISGSGLFPNILKSEDRQKFEQAQRNFINSVLRKESGAVISDEEFNNAKQQYFPQPGDTQSTLQQKANNRNIVINSYFRDANQQRPSSNTTVEANGSQYVVGQVYQDASGARWVVDAQGNWTKQ